MDAQPKLRLSRPTNHLEAILSFYVNGLGFEVLDRFDNQQGCCLLYTSDAADEL